MFPVRVRMARDLTGSCRTAQGESPPSLLGHRARSVIREEALDKATPKVSPL